MISDEPRTKEGAKKSVRIREDTHVNLRKAKLLLGLKSHDEVIFYFLNRFQSEWAALELKDITDEPIQSVLQQVNVNPEKSN